MFFVFDFLYLFSCFYLVSNFSFSQKWIVRRAYAQDLKTDSEGLRSYLDLELCFSKNLMAGVVESLNNHVARSDDEMIDPQLIQRRLWTYIPGRSVIN